MIVRILIWSLYDSRTTIDKHRESLPELGEPSMWIWSEASERLGAVVYGNELPEGIG